VEPNRANTTARCVERVLKRWREQRCGIGCRPGCRRQWRVSGTPGGERRQGHGHMHYEGDLGAIASKGDDCPGSKAGA